MKIEVKNYPWYNKRHHKESGGFRNIYTKPDFPPPLKAVRWLLSKIFDRANSANTPFRRIGIDDFSAPVNKYRLFWLGHSATLIQFKNVNILFDPNLNTFAGLNYLFGRKRLIPVPAHFSDLPKIDFVMISHNHYDHLDKTSVQRINRHSSPLFLVPLKMDKILRSWGVKNVLAMDWWQYVETGGMRISCVPAVHFSNRGVNDRDNVLWAGWYMEHLSSGIRIYYSGDTAYGAHFKEIAEHLGPPNLAILPIGAYEPRWFMKIAHINPEEAVQAFIDLKAMKLLGVHWGTFKLSDEPMDEPPELLRKHAEDKGVETERIHILPAGGSLAE